MCLGAHSLPSVSLFCALSSWQFPFSLLYFFSLFFFFLVHNSLFLSTLGNLPGTPQIFHTLVIQFLSDFFFLRFFNRNCGFGGFGLLFF